MAVEREVIYKFRVEGDKPVEAALNKTDKAAEGAAQGAGKAAESFKKLYASTKQAAGGTQDAVKALNDAKSRLEAFKGAVELLSGVALFSAVTSIASTAKAMYDLAAGTREAEERTKEFTSAANEAISKLSGLTAAGENYLSVFSAAELLKFTAATKEQTVADERLATTLGKLVDASESLRLKRVELARAQKDLQDASSPEETRLAQREIRTLTNDINRLTNDTARYTKEVDLLNAASKRQREVVKELTEEYSKGAKRVADFWKAVGAFAEREAKAATKRIEAAADKRKQAADKAARDAEAAERRRRENQKKVDELLYKGELDAEDAQFRAKVELIKNAAERELGLLAVQQRRERIELDRHLQAINATETEALAARWNQRVKFVAQQNELRARQRREQDKEEAAAAEKAARLRRLEERRRRDDARAEAKRQNELLKALGEGNPLFKDGAERVQAFANILGVGLPVDVNNAIDSLITLTAAEKDAIRFAVQFGQALTDGVLPVLNAMGESMAAAVVDAVLFGDSLEDALNRAAKAALREASIGALMETAKGLGALALSAFGVPHAGVAADAHFAAAAAYGVVASAAGVGVALTGGMGGGGGGSSADAAANARDTGTDRVADDGRRSIVINANFNGQPLHTQTEIQDFIARSLDAASQRRGRARFDASAFRR